MSKAKIIAVIGPTASGKTELGAYLAERFNGEIVSADSRQVFRGMDIGTAKELTIKVPQHLIDIKNPGEKITVAEYQQLAYTVIDQLLAKKITPFLVGGSGLYAEAVLNGYQFSEDSKSKTQSPRYHSLKIGISLDRELLRQRVAERTERWVREGLLEEIQALLDKGVSQDWLQACGQEYRYFTLYCKGELSLLEAIIKTNISINQFIKRQYTWWRRHPDIQWVKSKVEAAELVKIFLE